MGWIALLSALALNPGISPQNRAHCELAPTIGRGSSSAGQIDSISTLQAGCAYRLFQADKFSLWPKVAFSEQDWIIHRQFNQNTELHNFQARTILVGIETSYSFASSKVFYGLNYGVGKGQLNRTISSENSRQTSVFKDISQKMTQHEIGVQQLLSSRLALSASIQRTFARQSWDAALGSFQNESVDAERRLSLTNGSTRLLAPGPEEASYASTEIKIALQLLFD